MAAWYVDLKTNKTIKKKHRGVWYLCEKKISRCFVPVYEKQRHTFTVVLGYSAWILGLGGSWTGSTARAAYVRPIGVFRALSARRWQEVTGCAPNFRRIQIKLFNFIQPFVQNSLKLIAFKVVQPSIFNIFIAIAIYADTEQSLKRWKKNWRVRKKHIKR